MAPMRLSFSKELRTKFLVKWGIKAAQTTQDIPELIKKNTRITHLVRSQNFPKK